MSSVLPPDLNKYFVIYSLLLAHLSALNGQTGDWYFHHLTLEHGLSQAINSFVYQDSRGYVWVSSLDGLNRFEGRSIRVYRPNAADVHALKGNNMQSPFFEASNGDLWFCTYEAINCYRRQTDDFESFQLRGIKGNIHIKDYYIFHLSADGQLWIRLDDQLYLFDIHTHQYVHKGALKGIRCVVDTGANNQVTGIYSCFFGEKHGITYTPIHTDGRTGIPATFFSLNDPAGLPPAYVCEVRIEQDTLVWLTNDNGLIAFNPVLRTALQYAPEKGPYFWAVSPLEQGILAVSAAENGVWLFDKTVRKFTGHLVSETGSPRALASIKCQELNTDPAGNLWVTHWNSGLSYTNIRKKKFANIRMEVAFPALKDRSVELSGLIEDKYGRIWCSTEGEGIFLFDASRKPIRHFGGNRHLPDAYFTHLLRGRDETVWAVARKQLYRCDVTLDKFEPIPALTKVSELLFAFETSEGRLLLGTYAGIFEVTKLPSGKRAIIPAAGFESLQADMVDWIYEDQNGTVYVSKSASTLFIITHDRKIEFPFGGTKAAWEEPDGQTIWFATTSGLVKMDKHTFTYTLLDESWGLPNQYLYSIIPGAPGEFWMGSNRGVIRYQPANPESIRQYGRSDGLWSDEFFSNVWLRTGSGEIWMGNRDVLNVFRPEAIRDVAVLPKIQITHLKVNDLDWKGDTYIGECTGLKFPFDENTLSFNFAALEYSDPSKNRLKYLLEGYDKKWVELPSGTSGFARYARLPPGRYTLKIMASNSDGVWNPVPKELIIVIGSPIWQRWWFILLIAISVAFAAYGVYRYRLAQIRKELGFQQRVTASEMRALRAQMNPHFIFNSLNSINAYILRNLPVQASAYLTKFAELMRQILDNSAQETITLEEEIQFIQPYLEAESMRLEQKLTFHIQVDDSVDTFETQMPSMVLQPYLENAIWHGIAHKREGGKVDIHICREGNILVLRIEDNGIGRARARELRAARVHQHESKGLKITAERLALYDQKYGAQSTVTTTDLYDTEGHASGTRVTIKISA